jgi:hypothetical protein
MPYDISARGYLARAKQQLLRNSSESLFYAAFELRCCVETRQEEYATEIEYIKTKIKPWKIGATAKQLDQMFDSRKIARVTISLEKSESFTLYHTPVSKRLYKASEKLGELLHRMEKLKADDDPFWSHTRRQISIVYRDAWYSCQGQLLTPPLWDSKTKSVHRFKISGPSDRLKELLKQAAENNLFFKTEIAYVDQAPEEWVCDLPL